MSLKLETVLRSVPGVGTSRLALLEKLRLRTVADLLLLRPFRYEDRRDPGAISDAIKGADQLMRGRITAHGINRFKHGRKSVYELVLDDGTGRLHCRFWNLSYLQTQFSVGLELFVFGTISGLKPTTMEHPEWEVIQTEEARIHLNRLVPIHRATDGLSPRWLRTLVWRALEQVETPESTDELLACAHFRTRRIEQFRQLHFPDTLESAERARRHFALEEFLTLQRGFAHRRALFRVRAKSHPCAGDNRMIRPFLQQLDFELTAAQTRVLREIRGDLRSPTPMRRLLHGDVGSGKTVVAASAALMVVEAGRTVALMAPTEILAHQHHERFSSWLVPLGVTIALVTGRHKAGPAVQADLTIGTHALLEAGYQPANLGLVIIDEQHRFGVLQREKLVRKGAFPHLLVMTATPIPRTLGLTAYGDLDISVLDEAPARRGKVRTFLRTTAELPRIWQFVRDQIAEGRQGYLVYPRIDEKGGKAELKSVLEEHDRLRELLAPHAVGLLHGRMNAAATRRAMEDFRARRIQALVATTVVEVGLDVPNATVMVIENAGQFGLSQLHQLRGRIGRGAADSFCILVEDSRKADAVERLKVMLRSNDGFLIAEEDLRLRGVGDFLGTRQSGLPKLKFGDLVRDRDLVELARDLVGANPG